MQRLQPNIDGRQIRVKIRMIKFPQTLTPCSLMNGTNQMCKSYKQISNDSESVEVIGKLLTIKVPSGWRGRYLFLVISLTNLQAQAVLSLPRIYSIVDVP